MPIFLTAAAAGVGGYAAYKGGEKAIEAGKRTKTDMQRNRRRRDDAKVLSAKKNERSTRLADLQNRIADAKKGSCRSSLRSSSSSGTTTTATTTNNSEFGTNDDERASSVLDRFREHQAKTDKKKKGVLGRFPR